MLLTERVTREQVRQAGSGERYCEILAVQIYRTRMGWGVDVRLPQRQDGAMRAENLSESNAWALFDDWQDVVSMAAHGWV